jgi:hypothetical protein
MKFVVIFGPHAVSKMTVGQELSKITGLKLFHNHMTIDLVANFFSYGSPQGKRLVRLFRQEIFEAVSHSDLKGMIFTYMWVFNEKSDWDYIESVCRLFESRGGETYFVELEADFDVRIERNKTPNRLEHKPTKRDILWSENVFRSMEAKYRLNSNENELKKENYIRIDNTSVPPDEAARRIKSVFRL